METERRLLGDDGSMYTVPYSATDLSPYSSTSSTSADSSLNSSYYSELDWHQNADPNRMYYNLHERLDPGLQHLYTGYAAPPSADMYQPNSAVWHSQSVEVNSAPLNSSSSILPSFSRCSSTSSQGSVSLGPNGKPKRKRIQTQPQRKAANVRERKRMFHLNEAFDSLRLRLPAFNYEKRLSRIETLRLAITYIGFMKDVTDGKDPKDIKLAKDIHMDDFPLPSESPTSSKDPDTESE